MQGDTPDEPLDEPELAPEAADPAAPVWSWLPLSTWGWLGIPVVFGGGAFVGLVLVTLGAMQQGWGAVGVSWAVVLGAVVLAGILVGVFARRAYDQVTLRAAHGYRNAVCGAFAGVAVVSTIIGIVTGNPVFTSLLFGLVVPTLGAGRRAVTARAAVQPRLMSRLMTAVVVAAVVVACGCFAAAVFVPGGPARQKAEIWVVFIAVMVGVVAGVTLAGIRRGDPAHPWPPDAPR